MANVGPFGNASKLILSTILCGVGVVALAAPVHAATLTNVSATASSTAPSATNVTYTLTFTTATTLNPGNFLLLAIFPPGVTLPSTPCSSTISVSINSVAQNLATLLGGFCDLFPNAIQLALNAGQSVAAGSVVQVTIPGGTNGNPFPTSSLVLFETEFDNASPLPTLVGATPTAVPTPVLNPWALLTLAFMLAGMGYWWLAQQRQRRRRERV